MNELIVNIAKIWSEWINVENIKRLLEDIIEHEKRTGEKWLIVSSWAVKLWKEILLSKWIDFNSYSKELLASIWQAWLMDLYREFAWESKIIWEILLDDYMNESYITNVINSIRSSNWRNKLKGAILDLVISIIWRLSEKKEWHLFNLILDAIKNNVLLILNHNDALSSQELNNISIMTDNDNNVVHVVDVISRYCAWVNLRINNVLYLTNEDWVYDFNWDTYSWSEILEKEIVGEEQKLLSFVKKTNSPSWTGWMWSKIKWMFNCLRFWVKRVSISNIKNWLWFLFDDNPSKNTSFTLQKGLNE